MMTKQRQQRGARVVKVEAMGGTDDDVMTNACSSSDSSSSSSRRQFVMGAAALATLASSASVERADANANVKEVVIEAVPNERWIAVDAKVSVPEAWSTRPGQRAKRSQYVLYTDTYGPNYRYTTSLPKYLEDGAAKIDAAQLVVVSREGLDSIEDLGAQSKIDPARAFGVELEGIVAADTKKSSARSKNGQKYFQWELDDGAHAFLLSACVSGGGLYAFVMQVSADAFAADPAPYRQVLESLDIPRVEESRNDMSSRIYENRS
jgi:hypothetical protein